MYINEILAIEIFGLSNSYLLVKEFHMTLHRRFDPEEDSDLKTENNVESPHAPDEVL